jgi:hypothetical protein
MNIYPKRSWIVASATALVVIGAVAQFGISRAQTDSASPAPAPAPSAAPAELPKLPADLSPGLADVIKLTQSNVGDDVVVGYIKNSGKRYSATADEIVYLNDLGVSQNVIAALMQGGQGVASGPAPTGATPVETAPTAAAIPTAPDATATLSSPAVPTYNVTQDAPIPGTPPPTLEAPAPAFSETVVEQAPPPEVTVDYFQDQLAPYGSWVDVDGYGRCWRPSVAVVNAGWRPYCDNGYWVNTDSGWYWRSYYSWGWAPFHYGRWCSTPRFGWCWIPDCTWGPAWVAWRQHDAYCGWAPLPPQAVWRPGFGFVAVGGHGHVDWGFGLSFGAFTFVAYDHFTDRHPWRHQPARTEVVNIYNHSTVINNTVIVNNKTTIINNGIPKEKIAKATHKPVQTFALKDTGKVSDHGRIDHVAGKPALAVYRPSATVIAKTVATTPVHNKPVLINNSPKPASFTPRQSHIATAPVRTPASFNSPTVTPKANTHQTLPSINHTTPVQHMAPAKANSGPAVTPLPSRDAHQGWPGASVGNSFSTHSEASKPAAPAHVDPPVHSTAPAFSGGSRGVEQPNNYYGSGGYHSTGAVPSYGGASAGHSAAAPSYGHSAGGGVSAPGHQATAPSRGGWDTSGKNH